MAITLTFGNGLAVIIFSSTQNGMVRRGPVWSQCADCQREQNGLPRGIMSTTDFSVAASSRRKPKIFFNAFRLYRCTRNKKKRLPERRLKLYCCNTLSAQ